MSQGHRILLEAAASHARPPAGLEAEAGNYLTGGLRWAWQGRSAVFAGARGGRSVDAARGDWLAAFGGAELRAHPAGPFTFGLSLVGSGFSVREPDRYDAALIRTRPSISAPLGRARVEARLQAGIAWRRFGAAPARTDDRVEEVGGGIGARARVGEVLVEGSADLVAAGQARYRTLGASLEWDWARTRLHAEYGWWRVNDADGSHVVTLRVRIPLRRGLDWTAGAGRSPPDPLLGTESAVYASTGVSLDALESLRRRPPPVVRLQAGASPVRARFAVERDDASSVQLLGDFTGWDGVEMRRTDGGPWVAELFLPPGLYHFGFRVDGSWWVPDNAPGRTRDEWGRSTATVVVPGV